MSTKSKRGLAVALAASSIVVTISVAVATESQASRASRVNPSPIHFVMTADRRSPSDPGTEQASTWRLERGRLTITQRRARDHRAWLASLREARRRAAAARAAALRAPSPPSPSLAPSAGRGPDWTAIAACESGGNWHLNTGNGYWGGLQFVPSTWFAFGGGAFDGVGPFPYSPAQQIAVAVRAFASGGPSQWPVCFRWG